MKAWEVVGEVESASRQLSEALRRGRPVVLLPWAHPLLLSDFQPPFDWQQTPGQRHPLHKSLFFRLLRSSPRWDPEKPIPGDQIRSVVVFRYDAIGDYVVTTPLLRWLRQGLPQARLTVLSSTRNDALIAQDPHVDEHLPIHPTHTVHPSWIKAIWRLRRDHDVVFGLVFTHMSRAAFLARAIAPTAEYVVPLHWERARLYGLVFHRQIEYHPWKQHWAQALLLMGQRSISPCVAVKPFTGLYVPVSADACQRVWEVLQRQGIGITPPAAPVVWARGSRPLEWQALPGNPYVVLNLSAHSKERMWLVHHALIVCRELLQRFPDVVLFVTAAPRDRAMAGELVRQVQHPRCRMFTGSLSEFIALTAGAAWVLSPDTGPVHIASALGKPIVGLYGELFKIVGWHPFKAPFVAVVSATMEGITFAPPGAVVEAVELLLQEVIPRGFVLPQEMQPISAGS
ncbi:MAG: glycosyltransferase family 9 protein [Candidatus Kapabacteria bacterium]|nr:glycosyltransferase family 9 protein [Candidatus Kapabacteria bacterium]MDW8012171.1 glycosyltransferase family 9 protein [Bacteroidota bacterium]